MRVHIELYGGLHQVVGERKFEMEVAETKKARVFDVVELLVVVTPELRAALDGVAFAANDEVVDLKHFLRDGDTLALLPPVSGG